MPKRKISLEELTKIVDKIPVIKVNTGNCNSWGCVENHYEAYIYPYQVIEAVKKYLHRSKHANKKNS